MVAAEHLMIIIYEEFLLIFQIKCYLGGIFLNNGLIAICDEDSDYANNLAAYFRLKGSFVSDTVVFTEYENFSQHLENHLLDIIIIHEDFLVSFTNPSHNNLFILCENQTRDDVDNPHKIYKYSSAEDILRIVMANYDTKTPTTCLSYHKYKKSKIIGIASPLGRCGKTSFALSLGLNLSRNHSCLFITFDECSPLNSSLFKKQINNASLADIIYYYLQSMDISDNRILSCFQTFQGMDYISPTDQFGTYTELQSEELQKFMLNISGLGRYEYIIVDWSLFSFDYSLLKINDHLLIPTIDNDTYSNLKVSSFFDTIKSQYKTELILAKKVNLPLTSFTNISSEYTFSLTSLALGNFITSLIEELNL